MSNHRKLNKSLLIGLVLLGWSLPAFAEEYCFTPEQTSQIIVEIERGRKSNEIISQYEAALKSATEQVNLLSDKIGVLDQKFVEATKQIELQGKIADERDKARVDEIEELKKPRWSTIFGSFGLGSVSAALLLLLL